jgi:hypothetical protein
MAFDLVAQWLRDFHLPAIAAALISVVYFWAYTPAASLVRRTLASAHGVTTAALYAGAWLVYLTHHASDAWAPVFAKLMLVPLGLSIASFHLFRGNRLVHLLQLPHVLCLLWVWLRGTVVVTGFLF